VYTGRQVPSPTLLATYIVNLETQLIMAITDSLRMSYCSQSQQFANKAYCIRCQLCDQQTTGISLYIELSSPGNSIGGCASLPEPVSVFSVSKPPRADLSLSISTVVSASMFGLYVCKRTAHHTLLLTHWAAQYLTRQVVSSIRNALRLRVVTNVFKPNYLGLISI